MGFQDRDYNRSPGYGGGWSPFSGITPAVKYLLIANVVVFLAQIFSYSRTEDPQAAADIIRERNFNLQVALKQQMPEEGRQQIEEQIRQNEQRIEELERQPRRPRGDSVVTCWLELDLNDLFRGQIWRLVTYAFCHNTLSPWHIIFNMLGLWWWGPAIEELRGSREFLLLYLGSLLAGALAFIGLELITGGRGPMIGASAAVMGVVTVYAYHYPTAVIYIFWVIPVEMRYAVFLWALIDLHPVLLSLSGQGFHDNVAHSAHLGGMAFAFLYAWRGWHLSTLAEPLSGMIESWTKPRPRRRSSRNLRVFDPAAEPTGPRLMQTDDNGRHEEELDEVLRKMHEVGREGLTPAELAILEEASARLARKRRPE